MLVIDLASKMEVTASISRVMASKIEVTASISRDTASKLEQMEEFNIWIFKI